MTAVMAPGSHSALSGLAAKQMRCGIMVLQQVVGSGDCGEAG